MLQTTHWKQIWSLIALNAAIVISWIAYHNYQPQLLDQFNYNGYESFLHKAKLLILLIVPPLAGFVADRFYKPNDKRIPLVTSGVSFTALVFMVVASTIGANPIFDLSLYLPVMLVIWLISMNLFYAPALAMLEKFVPRAQFAVVMGLYVLSTDLVYALEPAIVLLIEALGAPITFVFGGTIVLVTGIWFGQNFKSWSKLSDDHKKRFEPGEEGVKGIQPLKIWGLAFLFGVVFAYLINILPNQIELKLIRADIGDYTGEVIVSAFLLITAFSAWVLSKRIDENNIKNTFIISFVLATVFFVISAYLKEVAALFPLLLAIPALALLSVCAFPMAMNKAGLKHKMLAAGLFISGAEFPDSFMEMFF